MARFNQAVGLLALLLLCGLASAQNPIPATSAYEDHGAYSINLQDLSIVFPVNFRQKSGLIPFSAAGYSVGNRLLSAQSHQGGAIYMGASYTGTVSPTMFPILGAGGTKAAGIKCPDGVTTTYPYVSWAVTTPGGDVHLLSAIAGSNPYVDMETNGTSCWYNTMTATTDDGSGLTVVVSVNPKSAVVYGPSGEHTTGTPVTTYGYFGFNWNSFYDSNGNSLSQSYDLSTETTTYTDSLGLTALTNVGGTTQTDSWTDVNGGSPHISVSQISLIQDTAFGCPSPNEDWTTNTLASYYMSGVSYANGTSLGITYEQTPGKGAGYTTGRITGLTIPTGGTVSFTYTGFNCTWLEPTTFKRTTTDGTWTYTWVPITGGNTTTVVDPAGNSTVYTFQQTYGGPFLMSKVVNQGASTVLSSTSLCYNTICGGNAVFPITQIDEYTTLTGMSSSKRTSKTFDTMGNELTSSFYDFGAGSPTFATTTTYGTWNGSACSAIGNYIINKPCTVSTTQNGTLIAQSRYTYDAHGNRLSSSSMASGSTWLTASAAYNSTGTVSTSTTVDGAVSSFTYGDCNGAFPTQATVGGITTNAAWNCDGGVKTSSTDGNGAITQYGYKNQGGTADPLWRVSSVTDPLGSATYTTYGSNTMETTLSFGSSVEDSIVAVDGYGRIIRKQTKDGSLYDTVSTKYNFPASTISTSIPCLVALGSDCTTGFTVSTMDGAGRTSSAVDGGGGTLTNAFLKNDVVSTLGPAPAGEHNKTTQAELDGVGRTLSICSILSSGGSSCGQVAGGSGIPTTFTYSASAGSTTTVATRGSQIRSRTYDALGRVTSITTPEGGTITNVYDSLPSSCNGETWAIPGALISTGYANGNYSCYQYDSLRRITAVTGNSGSGGAPVCRRLYYDNSSGVLGALPSGIAPQNPYGRMVEAETDTCAWPVTPSSMITDEWFSYDADGRLTDVWESTPHSGGYIHTSASYFANGVPASLSGIPGVGTITYGVNADGRWSTATKTGTAGLVSSVTYGPVGVTSIGVGSGTDADDYQFSAGTGKMTQYQFYVGSANTKGVLNWNTDGTLYSLAITDGFNSGGTQTCSFGYDDIARLTSDNCGSVWSQTFSFDQYDNLTKAGSLSWNPGYNTKNQYIGATYDASGNMQYDGSLTYTWDAFGKMAGLQGASGTPVCGTTGICVTYDAMGNLVERSFNSVYYQIVETPLGSVGDIVGGNTLYFVHIPAPGGGMIAEDSSHTYYLHNDWLGTARVSSIIPASGNGSVAYDNAVAPYGEMYDKFGPAGITFFTGDMDDILTLVLSDTPNRELHNNQGRWLSPDPAGTGWNQYAYPTNPNSNIDPSGLACYPLERAISGSCGPFMDNGVGFGASWAAYLMVMASTEVDVPGGPWQSIYFSDTGQTQEIQGLVATYPFASLADLAVLISGMPFSTSGGGANNGNQPLLTPQQQKALHCLGQTVKAKGLSIGLDVAGAIPGFGNLFSGAAAGIQGLNAAYYGTVSLANAGNTLLNPSASGAANTAATAGFAVASLALNGSKAIPVVGTIVSLGFLAYDVAGPGGAISTYQQCMAGPG